MAKQPDNEWRQHVLNNMLPRNEATLPEPATSLTPATDFGPTVFFGNRLPDDPTALLDGMPLVKMTALKQRAADLFAQTPTYEQVQEVRLAKISHSNRIAELMTPKGEGGFGLDASAPQVVAVRKQMVRAEKELARQTELKEVRTARWTVVGQLERSVSDWLLRGGVPGGCVLEAVEDQPISELMVKADGGRIDAAVERFRLRLRELAADLHRVRSSPWPSSVAKAAARELIDRLVDQGRPSLESAIEHGMPISFASMTLTSMVRNVDAPAIAHVETVDALGTLCWLFRDQLLAKIDAGFDEIADDKNSLDERQRAEIEAQINSDMLSIERNECSLIWIAESRGEIVDFRSTTSPQAVLGVRLRTQPRADAPGTSADHHYDIVGVGR